MSAANCVTPRPNEPSMLPNEPSMTPSASLNAPQPRAKRLHDGRRGALHPAALVLPLPGPPQVHEHPRRGRRSVHHARRLCQRPVGSHQWGARVPLPGSRQQLLLLGVRTIRYKPLEASPNNEGDLLQGNREAERHPCSQYGIRTDIL